MNGEHVERDEGIRIGMQWAMVVLLAGAALLLGVAQAQAATTVTGPALEALVSGKTAEGTLVKWKRGYKMYFDPSGVYRRMDSLGNRDKGHWSVTRDGLLCMEGAHRTRCRKVQRRDDGVYDVENQVGQVVWTIDKTVSGNPGGL